MRISLRKPWELRARGYRGSDTIVFDYLRPFRQRSGWQQTCQPELERMVRGIESTPLSARRRPGSS